MRIGVAAIVLAAAFLAVYLPDVGHGFVKDDFAWIVASRAGTWRDVAALFTTNVGFYRPLVSTTFAVDHAFWQLNPFGYGISNLALALADAALLFLLARRLALPPAGALAAAAIWAFNFHGVNMAVLWLSGRTSLLLVLFALAAAHAFLRGRTLAAGVLTLCAMLCKEEAVLLPLLWSVYATLDGQAVADTRRDGRPGARSSAFTALARTAPMWMALGVYAILRLRSGAFSPTDAPDYYQFTLAPGQLLVNVAEYADRGATVAAAAAILWLLLSRRTSAPWTTSERRSVILGALWFAAGYALTVFLPLRSSLYAVLPSIGSALIAGAIASRASRAHPVAFQRSCAILVALTVLLVPVYRGRNVRWTAAADLSTGVRNRLEAIAGRHPDGGTVILRDDAGRRITFNSTFDTQFPKAATLFMGPRWTGAIEGVEVPAGAEVEGTVVRIERKEFE
jgi:hypothetical protein